MSLRAKTPDGKTIECLMDSEPQTIIVSDGTRPVCDRHMEVVRQHAEVATALIFIGDGIGETKIRLEKGLALTNLLISRVSTLEERTTENKSWIHMVGSAIIAAIVSIIVGYFMRQAQGG